MRSDTADKDASLENQQRHWEPWKALLAAFGAGVAVTMASGALLSWILMHIIR